MIDLITNDSLYIASLAFIVFAAGVVRGCIGFGFSALVVAGGALFLSPADLVPLVVLLEVAASVQMLRSAWPSVNWRAHNWLLLAVLLWTPLGVLALAVAPDQVLRVIVALLALIMASILLSGFRIPGELGRVHLLLVGSVAGVFNGVAGIGGMPMAVYLSSTSLSMTQVRATLVMLFFGSEAVFIASALMNDVFNRSILNTAVLAIVPMAAGVWAGSRFFERVDESKLRRLTVITVFTLALVGLVRAVVGLFGASA